MHDFLFLLHSCLSGVIWVKKQCSIFKKLLKLLFVKIIAKKVLSFKKDGMHYRAHYFDSDIYHADIDNAACHKYRIAIFIP